MRNVYIYRSNVLLVNVLDKLTTIVRSTDRAFIFFYWVVDNGVYSLIFERKKIKLRLLAIKNMQNFRINIVRFTRLCGVWRFVVCDHVNKMLPIEHCLKKNTIRSFELPTDDRKDSVFLLSVGIKIIKAILCMYVHTWIICTYERMYIETMHAPIPR